MPLSWMASEFRKQSAASSHLLELVISASVPPNTGSLSHTHVCLLGNSETFSVVASDRVGYVIGAYRMRREATFLQKLTYTST